MYLDNNTIVFCVCFPGVVSCEQYVYAVGGYDGTNQLHTVERYDVETNQWEIISPMNRPRSALSVAVVDSKIYALGNSSNRLVVYFFLIGYPALKNEVYSML